MGVPSSRSPCRSRRTECTSSASTFRAWRGSSYAPGITSTPTSASSVSTTPRRTTCRPTVDELFREAARNHERERVYQAERTVTRAKKREADHERRLQVAQAFLTDRAQRAVVHPAPSPKRCYVSTDQGRILFDVGTDEGPARDVPPEAHRRFRADLAARHDKNQQDRAAQLAIQEEKKRNIAEWISEHGTPEQQTRQAAGMLPNDSRPARLK